LAEEGRDGATGRDRRRSVSGQARQNPDENETGNRQGSQRNGEHSIILSEILLWDAGF
jgi:hypothetical protein